MRLIKIGLTAILVVLAVAAFSETSEEATIKKLIEARLGDSLQVHSVKKTPYGGLYEVRTGNDILYTDNKADYLFSGHVIDTRTRKDFTRERLEEISRIKFSDLPLDLALKMVKGDGKRVIAVFEDPNCGYCKHFRRTLSEMQNITVYTFMYNILAPDSAVKSRNIWCSANHAHAWDDWMLEGKAPAAAPEKCIAPNEKVLALGQKVGVNSTPTIFFTDGSRGVGAPDGNALEAKLGSLK
jgi:thiol:disulfide interchange protein DsbC